MKNVLVLESTTLPTYAWVIIAIFVFLIIVGLVIFLIFARKKKDGLANVDRTPYLKAIGGEDNLLKAELRGSRIILTCKSYENIDHEALKRAGVTGFIQSSDKLTLVLRNGAEELYHSLTSLEEK